MWTYEVISEAAGVPTMTDLGEPYISAPARPGDVFSIRFPKGYTMTPLPYENAVGKRCVVRRSEDDVTQECGGAVAHVTPDVLVRLDGAGWQSGAPASRCGRG